MFYIIIDNLHLYDDGPERNLQVIGDSDMKILHIPSFGCQQNFTLSSIGSQVYTESIGNGVHLYVKDEANYHIRYYLRLNQKKGYSLELMCQNYVETVSDSLVRFTVLLTYFSLFYR